MAEPRKASLAAVFITVFIDLLGFGIVLPLIPRYGQHFQINEMMLGLLMASFSAMQFVFAPFWARVSDRVGRRPILLLGLAGSCVCYALFGYATALGGEATLLGFTTVTWLFVSRIGAGIAGATIPTAQAYIADITGAKERGKGMALIGAAFGVGFTFGPLLGAMFVPDVSDSPSPAPGYIASGLSAMAFLYAMLVLPESLNRDSQPTDRHILDIQSLKVALGRPAIRKLLVTIFLATFAFAQFESTLSLLTKQLGLGDKSNFYVFAYIGLVLSLSQGMFVRRLLPKIGEQRMAVTGTALMVTGLLLIAWASTQTSLTALYIVLPVSVVGFSAVTPSLNSLLSLRTAAEDQGGMLGLGQSMSALARILGPAIGMPLFGWMQTAPYLTGGLLMGLVCVLVLTLGTSRSEEPVNTGDHTG